jgi:hypothetical protein
VIGVDNTKTGGLELRPREARGGRGGEGGTGEREEERRREREGGQRNDTERGVLTWIEPTCEEAAAVNASTGEEGRLGQRHLGPLAVTRAQERDRARTEDKQARMQGYVDCS